MVSVEILLAVAGALLVMLGFWCRRDARRALQGRTWLRVGLIFCAVAAWLRWRG